MHSTTNAIKTAQLVIDNTSKVIVGKRDVIELAVATLIAQGHLLVEDVPGVGKTMLAKSLAPPLVAVSTAFNAPRIYCPATLRGFPYITSKMVSLNFDRDH